MKILITGGAGYIGSITNWLLKKKGHETVVFDNLVNGHKEAVGDTELIVGDLRDKDDIAKAFSHRRFDSVIHFAALALAGESMEKPYDYFQNNILGGLNLLEAMRDNRCDSMIFSSTCAVYGFPDKLPVTEQSPIAPVSVYGASKRNFEEILDWYGKIYQIKSMKLRYFNACGAVPDGSLGEAHANESHIIPILLKCIMLGKPFSVFGNDYDTPDKTCIRDYIHVLDLADAHLKAAEYLKKQKEIISLNLGMGKGYSNMEVIRAAEKVTGSIVEVMQKPRRLGDPDAIYADNTKAKQVLGWVPQYTSLESIIKTAWKWHSSHPNGFTK